MKQTVQGILRNTQAFVLLRPMLLFFKYRLASAWVRGVLRFGLGHRATIGFTPDTIENNSQMTRIMLLNRYVHVPRGRVPDIGVYWAYGAHDKAPETNWRLEINERCRDISKSHVDQLQRDIFGYGAEVHPFTFEGRAFVKSDDNALHDGHIETLPVKATAPGVVYHRLIANEMPDGTRQDIRIPLIGETIPHVYLLYRRLEQTIGERVLEKSRMCETNDVLSHAEVENVLRLCRAIGLDFGEIDALRDEEDRRLYVVDVNRAVGFSVKPSEADHWKQLYVLADLFDTTFVAPALEERSKQR